MSGTKLVLSVLVLMAFGLLGGCGGGGTPSMTETPVGLTKTQKDELTAKFKAEAKQNIKKENAEKIAKDLEAEIASDPEQ